MGGQEKFNYVRAYVERNLPTMDSREKKAVMRELDRILLAVVDGYYE